MEDKIEIPAGFLSEMLQAATEAVSSHVDDVEWPPYELSPQVLRQLRELIDNHPEEDVKIFVQSQIDGFLEEA